MSSLVTKSLRGFRVGVYQKPLATNHIRQNWTTL